MRLNWQFPKIKYWFWCFRIFQTFPKILIFPVAEWGEWQNTSSCSRSCGGGTVYQTRVCHLPQVVLLHFSAFIGFLSYFYSVVTEEPVKSPSGDIGGLWGRIWEAGSLQHTNMPRSRLIWGGGIHPKRWCPRCQDSAANFEFSAERLSENTKSIKITLFAELLTVIFPIYVQSLK